MSVRSLTSVQVSVSELSLVGYDAIVNQSIVQTMINFV